MAVPAPGVAAGASLGSLREPSLHSRAHEKSPSRGFFHFTLCSEQKHEQDDDGDRYTEQPGDDGHVNLLVLDPR